MHRSKDQQSSHTRPDSTLSDNPTNAGHATSQSGEKPVSRFTSAFSAFSAQAAKKFETLGQTAGELREAAAVRASAIAEKAGEFRAAAATKTEELTGALAEKTDELKKATAEKAAHVAEATARGAAGMKSDFAAAAETVAGKVNAVREEAAGKIAARRKSMGIESSPAVKGSDSDSAQDLKLDVRATPATSATNIPVGRTDEPVKSATLEGIAPSAVEAQFMQAQIKRATVDSHFSNPRKKSDVLAARLGKGKLVEDSPPLPLRPPPSNDKPVWADPTSDMEQASVGRQQRGQLDETTQAEIPTNPYGDLVGFTLVNFDDSAARAAEEIAAQERAALKMAASAEIRHLVQTDDALASAHRDDRKAPIFIYDPTEDMQNFAAIVADLRKNTDKDPVEKMQDAAYFHPKTRIFNNPGPDPVRSVLPTIDQGVEEDPCEEYKPLSASPLPQEVGAAQTDAVHSPLPQRVASPERETAVPDSAAASMQAGSVVSIGAADPQQLSDGSPQTHEANADPAPVLDSPLRAVPSPRPPDVQPDAQGPINEDLSAPHSASGSVPAESEDRDIAGDKIAKKTQITLEIVRLTRRVSNEQQASNLRCLNKELEIIETIVMQLLFTPMRTALQTYIADCNIEKDSDDKSTNQASPVSPETQQAIDPTTEQQPLLAADRPLSPEAEAQKVLRQGKSKFARKQLELFDEDYFKLELRVHCLRDMVQSQPADVLGKAHALLKTQIFDKVTEDRKRIIEESPDSPLLQHQDALCRAIQNHIKAFIACTSILVLPAFYYAGAALYNKYQYNTGRFWLPRSRRLLSKEKAVHEKTLKNLGGRYKSAIKKASRQPPTPGGGSPR